MNKPNSCSRHLQERRVICIVLALIWLVTAWVCLFCFPHERSFMLLGRLGLSAGLIPFVFYGAVLLDVLIGLITLLALFGWDKKSFFRFFWVTQAGLIVGYSVVVAIYLPEFLIHPFAPILKNIAVLVLLWLLYRRDSNKEVGHDLE